MERSVVCGVDGSPDSRAALGVAAGMAERLQLQLVVAHIGEPAYVLYAAAAPFGGMAGLYALMPASC